MVTTVVSKILDCGFTLSAPQPSEEDVSYAVELLLKTAQSLEKKLEPVESSILKWPTKYKVTRKTSEDGPTVITVKFDQSIEARFTKLMLLDKERGEAKMLHFKKLLRAYNKIKQADTRTLIIYRINARPLMLQDIHIDMTIEDIQKEFIKKSLKEAGLNDNDALQSDLLTGKDFSLSVFDQKGAFSALGKSTKLRDLDLSIHITAMPNIKVTDVSMPSSFCDFRILTSLPENYDNLQKSYVLIMPKGMPVGELQLKYIDSEGGLTDVLIKDKSKLWEGIKKIYTQVDPLEVGNRETCEIRIRENNLVSLCPVEIHTLITQNGGHNPSPITSEKYFRGVVNNPDVHINQTADTEDIFYKRSLDSLNPTGLKEMSDQKKLIDEVMKQLKSIESRLKRPGFMLSRIDKDILVGKKADLERANISLLACLSNTILTPTIQISQESKAFLGTGAGGFFGLKLGSDASKTEQILNRVNLFFDEVRARAAEQARSRAEITPTPEV
ncbi:MAG: hypothetical protein NTV32_07765 [Gammaproteobacteria bacterium]|nr:hypothetical protein [Gammaproteobacteria bacterium]